MSFDGAVYAYAPAGEVLALVEQLATGPTETNRMGNPVVPVVGGAVLVADNSVDQCTDIGADSAEDPNALAREVFEFLAANSKFALDLLADYEIVDHRSATNAA